MLAIVCQMLELFSMGVVIVCTVYIMQCGLAKAHHLLRLGLALVCAGSAIELYETLQYADASHVHAVIGTVENVGQAVIYGWAALSKRLWKHIKAVGA